MNNFPFKVGLALVTWVTTGIGSVHPPSLVAQTNVDRRIPSIEKLTAQGSNIERLWQQASELRGIGRYSEAIAIFDQILKVQPNSFLAWYWRGNSFSNLGEYKTAIGSYEQAIKIKPDYLLAWYEQGNAFYALGQYDAVVRSWRQALSLKGESEYGQQLVSRIIPRRIADVLLYDLQQYEEAIGFYNQLTSVESNTAAIWIDRGTAFYQLGRYREALVDYDRAIQLDTNNALAWKRRGFALYRLNRNQQAIASFERAAKLEPNDLEIGGLLAVLQSAGESPAESSTSQQRLATLRREITAAEQRLLRLRADSQTATTQLETSQAQVRQSQQRLATIQGEIKTAEERLTTSQTQVRQSQQQLTEIQAEIQTIQKQRDSLQAERQSLEQRLAAVRGEIKTAEGQLERTQSQVRQSQQQLAGVGQEIQTTQKQLDSLRAERQSLEQRLAAVRGEIKTTEERLTASQAELRQSQQQLTGIRQEIQNTEKQRDTLQAELQNLEQRLAAVRGDIKTVEGQLNRLQAQVRQSQQQLAGVQQEIQNTQKQRDTLQAERQSLEQRLTNGRGELNTIEKQVAALQTERQRLEQRQTTGGEITQAVGAGLEAFQAELQIFQRAGQLESGFTDTVARYLGIPAPPVKTLTETLSALRQIEQATASKPGLVYSSFVPKTQQGESTSSGSKGLGFEGDKLALSQNQKEQDDDQLELVVISSDGKPIRQRIGATRSQIRELTQQYLSNITNARNPNGYLEPSQKLYQLLVAPLEKNPAFQGQNINNLTFLMDKSLRGVPLAALHDGKGFLVERYSVGVMPSLALTDTRYGSVKNQQVLAMGAQVFPDQRPLPAVPTELNAIVQRLWSGDSYLNEAFTIDNLQKARQQESHGIVHFATHAEFRSGQPSNSYIELWGGNKLRLDQLRQLKLDNPPVDLLVLSACRTALGNDEAELGFSGLAVQAGVKAAMGSLWYVSDEGTLGLMTAFYKKLKQAPTKAEAMRQAQVAMLRGDVRIEGGQLIVENERIPLPPELAKLTDRKFTHPYYWSAFMMVGNPW
jgi:CHAT domain-containing protein/tetratricopeptide (TPR) repeat protein